MNWLSQHRLLVCVGTGGVGKTTVSAALALAAASSGIRTLVMTIDPARRLANALGLGAVGNVPYELGRDRLREAGIDAKASLHVLMPDVSRTFDDLVRRHAPDGTQAAHILENRFYRVFTTQMAGAQEYAAVEALHAACHDDRYDLVVLDTPPSQSALEFFHAPVRIVDFLEHETLLWLMKPYTKTRTGRFSLKLLDVGSSVFTHTLGKLAGAHTLRELFDFIFAFRGMYQGFRQRAAEVRTLLLSQDTGFVLVTTPSSDQEEVAQRFHRQLAKEGITLTAVVANRVRAQVPEPTADLASQLAKTLSSPDAERVSQIYSEEYARSCADAAAVSRLRAVFAPATLVALPELPGNASALTALATLSQRLRAADAL